MGKSGRSKHQVPQQQAQPNCSASNRFNWSALVGVLASVVVAYCWRYNFEHREPAPEPGQLDTQSSDKPSKAPQRNLEQLRLALQDAKRKSDAGRGSAEDLKHWLNSALEMDSALVEFGAPADVREYTLKEIQAIVLTHMRWNDVLRDRQLLANVAPRLVLWLSSKKVIQDCCKSASCITDQIRTMMILRELGQHSEASTHFTTIKNGSTDGGAAYLSPTNCLGGNLDPQRLVAPQSEHYPTGYADVVDIQAEPNFWGPEAFSLSAYLEEHAETIMAELTPLCPTSPKAELHSHFGLDGLAAYLAQDTGTWTTLPLFHDGVWNASACKSIAPNTCTLLRSRPEIRGTLRSAVSSDTGVQIAFVSVYRLQPGAHIHRHVGYQWRLSTHLGIVVPDGAEIRVWGERRPWGRGKAFGFLDAAEHEVVHNGISDRCVLNVVAWHPSVLARREADAEFARHFINPSDAAQS